MRPAARRAAARAPAGPAGPPACGLVRPARRATRPQSRPPAAGPRSSPAARPDAGQSNRQPCTYSWPPTVTRRARSKLAVDPERRHRARRSMSVRRPESCGRGSRLLFRLGAPGCCCIALLVALRIRLAPWPRLLRVIGAAAFCCATALSRRLRQHGRRSPRPLARRDAGGERSPRAWPDRPARPLGQLLLGVVDPPRRSR